MLANLKPGTYLKVIGTDQEEIDNQIAEIFDDFVIEESYFGDFFGLQWYLFKVENKSDIDILAN